MKSGKALGNPNYRQSFTMKIYLSHIMISLTQDGKVEILKNRFGEWKEKTSTEEVIDILMTILTNHIFDGGMDMFQEGLKQELIKVIKYTTKRGVAECEPHFKNELLEWDSNV